MQTSTSFWLSVSQVKTMLGAECVGIVDVPVEYPVDAGVERKKCVFDYPRFPCRSARCSPRDLTP